MIELRASLLQGDFDETQPSPRLRLRAWLAPLGNSISTITFAGLGLLILGLIAWRECRSSRNENAPRVFGLLLLLWGLLIVATPILFFVTQGRVTGMLYYTTTGLLFALSGLYAFVGRPVAAFWYATGYFLSLGWTFVDYDLTHRQFYMQLGMPTLMGIYMWRLSRQGRLAPP